MFRERGFAFAHEAVSEWGKRFARLLTETMYTPGHRWPHLRTARRAERSEHMPHRDTRALVAHLFRRAGFGLRPEELDRFTSIGIRGSVEYLLNYDAVPDPAETRFPAPDLAPWPPS